MSNPLPRSHPPSARRRALAVLSLLSTLLGGCVMPEPLAEVEFTYADFSGGEAPASWLSLRFDDGSGEREVRLESGTQNGPAIVFPRIRTNTSGLLHVRAALVRAPGDTAAKANLTLTLHPDWRWGVDLFTAAGSYDRDCNGCAGHESFPFRPALNSTTGLPPLVVPDSLHVVWGGTSLSRLSVY